MLVVERRQSWIWLAVMATALLLLAGIIIAIIMISTRLRQAERATVIQQVPVPVPSTPSSSASQPAGSSPAPRSASSGAAASPGSEKPAKVKVVERQVKVVEKQVRVIEKPVKVVQKPAAMVGGKRQDTRDTFQDTGLPERITYDGKEWVAAERIKGLPADLLGTGTHQAGGRTVYHDRTTGPPYPHIYVAIEGRTDQYVRYVPAGR